MTTTYTSYDQLPLALCADDVAAVLGISRANAYTLMRAKGFPTIFIGTDTYNLAAPGHSWQITACAGHSIGYKGMLLGAKALAATGVEVAENMEILEKAKAEFAEQMKGKPYKCPITPELPIPQPQV